MLSIIPPDGDTSGFYKLDGELLYAPNYVLNRDYTLTRETKDQHTYPVDGWQWFDSEDEARLHHGLPIENAPRPERPDYI